MHCIMAGNLNIFGINYSVYQCSTKVRCERSSFHARCLPVLMILWQIQMMTWGWWWWWCVGTGCVQCAVCAVKDCYELKNILPPYRGLLNVVQLDAEVFGRKECVGYVEWLEGRGGGLFWAMGNVWEFQEWPFSVLRVGDVQLDRCDWCGCWC
jgi:hypothetical protein